VICERAKKGAARSKVKVTANQRNHEQTKNDDTPKQVHREAVRQAVEAMLHEQVGLDISGYKCDMSTVLNVVVKAAFERYVESRR